MPTQTGSIWAHDVGYRIVNSGIDYVTLNFAQPRTITVNTAIALLTSDCRSLGSAECFWAECGIYQTSVDPAPFDPPLPRIIRSNVRWIRFRGAVSGCRIRYRWSIHFWE